MAVGDFGLRPVKRMGNRGNSVGIQTYLVSNGYATNLFRGDPVKLSAGNVVLAGNGDKVLGVFMGASYIDTDGRPQHNAIFPSGTSVATAPIDAIAGIAQPVAYVADDPDLVMVVRADSSVSVGQIGLNFRLSAGSGSTTQKLSGHNLKVTTATTSGADATSADKQTMVRLIGVYNTPGNSIGSANPLVEVIWVAHHSKFTNA